LQYLYKIYLPVLESHRHQNRRKVGELCFSFSVNHSGCIVTRASHNCTPS